MFARFLQDPLIGGVFRFMCLYGVLIAPWPEWNEIYGQYFRSITQMVFAIGDSRRVIVFSPNTDATHPNLDTKLSMSNRDILDAIGKGLTAETEIDTRSIGWLPTALTMSLILATPISYSRRLISLLGGLILVQGFILFSMLTWVWDNSNILSLMTLAPFWQVGVDELNYALVNQLGASFSVPVVIWILVTFRRKDLETLSSSKGPARRPKETSRTATPSSLGPKPLPASKS